MRIWIRLDCARSVPGGYHRGRKMQAALCSFRFDERRLDDRRPARDLAFDQGGELLLAAPGFLGNFAAELDEVPARILVIERLVEREGQLVEHRFGRPLGCKQAVP